MTKKFEVVRLHKYEDWIDQQIADTVYELINDFYGVDDPNDLTAEQINSISEWVEQHDSFYLGPRFRLVIDDWNYENAGDV